MTNQSGACQDPRVVELKNKNQKRKHKKNYGINMNHKNHFEEMVFRPEKNDVIMKCRRFKRWSLE